MRTRDVDVIVVGAGLGGLSAAATLARAARSVVVLEQHRVPGGYAHEFRRGPYRFEVSLHGMDGVGPGGMVREVLSQLGVLSRVAFTRLDPFYVARLPDLEITAHADAARYEEELGRAFPRARDGIRALLRELAAVYGEARALAAQPPSSPKDLAARAPTLLRATGETWGEFMDRHIRDTAVRAAVSVPWSYYGLPPSRLCAAQFAIPWGSYHLSGAYYPRGGSMAVSRALEAAVREAGGEIRYGQTVERIVVEGGRAVAVRIAGGEELRARAVVSNASVPDTLLRLVGREHLPGHVLRRLEGTAPSLSSFIVYLGLEHAPVSGPLPHELFLAEREGDPEAQYRAVLAGDWSRTQLVLASYAAADPGCAPADGAVLAAMTLAPWKHEGAWGASDLARYRTDPGYRELKRRTADAILDRLERLRPGVRASIAAEEVATPLTNGRYSRNPSGAIYGFEQSVDGLLARRAGPRTPISNLFVAGAWTAPGAGQSAAILSGHAAALAAGPP